VDVYTFPCSTALQKRVTSEIKKKKKKNNLAQENLPNVLTLTTHSHKNVRERRRLAGASSQTHKIKDDTR
jgi:hypothetical protein